MKILYLTGGSNILVDTENETANRIESARQAIDRIYLAEEPMHVVFGEGETHAEADVKKGDLIITFFCRDFKNRMVVVKNKQWAENITLWEKAEQEEKERWAKVKEAKCDGCEACPNICKSEG